MTRLIFRSLAILLTVPAIAQTQGVELLLSKARSLEARGRTDLAAQNWKQVLLVSPNQSEALAGLAREAKENGETDQERAYLERLKKVDPKDPEIAEIENMRVLTAQDRSRLDEAGRLTMQHKPDDAMKIYKEVLGDQPPYGKWMEPYYDAEAASSGGRKKATAQLRLLSERHPSDEIYRLWLGRVLVDDPATRMEGLQLLQSIHDPVTVDEARGQWRQALLWEKENPAVLMSVNAYLQRYPDQELQEIQKSLQQKREQMEEDASKQRGFQALRGKDMSAAESDFQAVLQRSPDDANAVIGMAFVRLNQKRFDEAASLFERARLLAPKRSDVREGYETAKFWSFMQQGSNAVQRNDLGAAVVAYQNALAVHPHDVQATLGMAEAHAREKQLPEAETAFGEVLSQSPGNIDAISGLAFIRLDEKRFDDAVNLFDQARRLAPSRADLNQGYKDAKYWSLMQQAAVSINQNRNDVAIADYQQALKLRPGALDALHGLVGAAERGRNNEEAVQAYRQLATASPTDAQTWLGLIRAQLNANSPQQALDTAQKIPPAIKPIIETRPDYLSEMALANYLTKQPDEGDRMLTRAMNVASPSESNDALNARLEAASLLMDQGKTNRAIEVYQQAAKLHPENAIAWQGLVGAYSRQQNFSAAKMAVRSMPQDVYQTASRSTGFLDAVAAMYSADGECSEAEDLLNRSLTLDRDAGHEPATSTHLQLADIWRREGNYAKAQQSYRQIITKSPDSVDAWRGYLTVLHDQKEDQELLTATKNMPADPRAQLEKDPNFLLLLASAESTSRHAAETVQLLRRARALYVSRGQAPRAELDLQLAWAMLADNQADLPNFLRTVKARTDLTAKQRAAIDEIWSAWTVHAADEDMKEKKPQQAIAILTEAQFDLPNDPKIYAALASVYSRQHNYRKALEVFQSWGMNGAEAGDYRAAAGTAMAAHKADRVDFYLNQGLQHFPQDPGLLEMKGKEVVANGNYEAGQDYLKSALRAAENPNLQQQNFVADQQIPSRANSSEVDRRPNPPNVMAPPEQVPACRQNISYRALDEYHVKLASLTFDDQGTGGDQDSNTNQNSKIQEDSIVEVGNVQQEQRLQDEIDVVQNRNTPFVDVGDTASGRAGDAGIDRLIVEDGVIGGSVVATNTVRISALAEGIYLLSGTPNGQSKSRFGTLAPGALFPQQSTGGMTGQFQLSTATFGLEFDPTPSEFPVSNLLGGLRFRPANGPITFTLTRDSVKDSLLSYAGVRDPATGVIWGGVVSNTGTVQFDHKARRAGQYASVSFSYLTGKNVPSNWAGSGNAGFYVVIAKGLSLGLSVAGMHYDKNLSFFSLGQGGYFSPQAYGLAAIPISWYSRHERFEYEIRASLGAQYFSQDSSAFFPTQVGVVLPAQGVYFGTHNTGPNYSFLARLGYRLAPHVYFDTFASANNARNYAVQSVGFSLKFMLHRLPIETDLHPNSVPDWKGNQPFAIQ